MVLDRELRAEARLEGVAGIAGMLIDPGAFKRPSRVAEGTLDVDGVATVLGVDREAAYAILDAGLMARVTDHGRAIRTTRGTSTHSSAITSPRPNSPLA